MRTKVNATEVSIGTVAVQVVQTARQRLTSSSFFPLSPFLLAFLCDPGSSSPACPPPFSVQNKSQAHFNGGANRVPLQCTCTYCQRPAEHGETRCGLPWVGPASPGSGWSPGGASRRSDRPIGGRCRAGPGRQSTPRTPAASAAGNWKRAWSFCILPERGGGTDTQTAGEAVRWRNFLTAERSSGHLHCEFPQAGPRSPQHPSSSCGPSPLPAAPSGLHQRCPLLPAVQPWPEAFQFPRSAREPFLPERRNKRNWNNDKR